MVHADPLGHAVGAVELEEFRSQTHQHHGGDFGQTLASSYFKRVDKVGGRFGPGDLDTPHDASTLEVQAGEEILLVQHVQLVPQLFGVPNFCRAKARSMPPAVQLLWLFERNPILGQGLVLRPEVMARQAFRMNFCMRGIWALGVAGDAAMVNGSVSRLQVRIVKEESPCSRVIAISGNFGRRAPIGGFVDGSSRTELSSVRAGDSIALDGVCLTVVDPARDGLLRRGPANLGPHFFVCPKSW